MIRLTHEGIRQRVILIMVVVLYVFAFNWTYRAYINPMFAYYGLGYLPPPLRYQVISWALCVIPALWMPMQLFRPSLLLFYLQYFMLYMPATFVVYHYNMPQIERADALSLVVFMFIGLSVMQSVYYLPLVRIRAGKFKVGEFWVMSAAVLVLALAYLLAVFGPQAHFTNIANADMTNAYRDQYGDTASQSLLGSRFTGYMTLWIQNVLLTVIIAAGLFSKRYWMTAAGLFTFVFFFAVQGTKTSALSPLAPILVYAWVKKTSKGDASKLALGLTALLMTVVPLTLVGMTTAAKWLVVLFHFRSITSMSLVLCQYFTFFQHNPLTHMAHLMGSSLVMTDPYPQGSTQIPFMVADYIYGVRFCDNAGMWAWDGIGGFGLAGIVLVSAMFACVLWILDCVSVRLKPAFVAVALALIAGVFLNTNIQLTFVSQGLAALIILLALLPDRGLLHHAFRTHGLDTGTKEQ
ncbi:MAG: hypothetical protein ACYC64_18275 [Armatimonadota bacterium]